MIKRGHNPYIAFQFLAIVFNVTFDIAPPPLMYVKATSAAAVSMYLLSLS
jgi:hypothetical protein